jgi:pimeloyl-ACP methyl ester carboxylesterase
MPTVVIHGENDVVVPLASGRDTAENIPGAELIVFPKQMSDSWPGDHLLLFF